MGYPSLLYAIPPKNRPMSLTVFEDLQLTHFIPRSVAKTVRIPCEKDNILARQRLFAAFAREGARETYASLRDMAEEMAELKAVYESPRCQAERLAAFAAFFEIERRFSAAAANAGLGDPLSDRFAAAFAAERRDPRYQSMEASLDRLNPAREALTRNRVSVSRGEIRLRADADETYFDRILSCADRLKIETPRVKAVERRRLSPDLLTAAVSLRPETLAELKTFETAFSPLYQPAVTYYGKEIAFYLTMLSLFDKIRAAGIPIAYPTVGAGRGLRVTEAYDVSLLAKGENVIVPNDISFSDGEPFFFLTGANGGGKTTYLRAVGIAATLVVNGCPLPCRSAEIGEISGIFTHFPRDERFDGSGRFVEENNRVQKILEQLDDNSLVLLNETYATTNEENAVRMTESLARDLHARRSLGLYITHQHALSDVGVPYLNVLIDKNDANRRTFKIAREKSTGGSYAADILARCGLTREALEARFGPLPGPLPNSSGRKDGA